MSSSDAPSKHYTDDVSLLIVIVDANPFFWASPSTSFSFSKLLGHVSIANPNPDGNSKSRHGALVCVLLQLLPFLDSTLLLNQLNHVVVVAAGVGSCGYLYDSSVAAKRGPDLFGEVLRRLGEFVQKDRDLCGGFEDGTGSVPSLLSGSLSLALCYIQRIFRSGPIHPQPRILCLQGSPDGPEQYVAVMNAIFSAQRSSVPIDSCIIGSHSAFLQQASHITGGVYLKPQQLDGLFQCLCMVFATDLQSRNFLQLPKPVGVDFRASCFCHKTTISMGYVCSVCLSIFCKRHKKCSTCGSDFSHASQDSSSTMKDRKRKLTGA